MPNAIAYVRCSTTEQSDSGLGIDAQRAAIESAADRLGLTISAWHSDEGISGGSLDKRVGLLDAIDAIGRGDVLLIAKRDRLARDVLLASWIEKEVAKRGGRIISAAGEGTDSDDPTAMLMRRIIDAFAEYERLTIKARTKAALRVLARRGQRVSRFPPYGFDFDAENKLVENGQEQATIARILGMRQRDGMKLQQIARELTRCGVPTKRNGRGWRYQQVAKILQRAKDGNDGKTEAAKTPR